MGTPQLQPLSSGFYPLPSGCALLWEGARPLLARLGPGYTLLISGAASTQTLPALVSAVWVPCSPPLPNLLLSPALLRALLEQPIAQSAVTWPSLVAGRGCDAHRKPSRRSFSNYAILPPPTRAQGARAAGLWVLGAHLEG